MASYYHKSTSQKVEAEKVKEISETFTNSDGVVVVTQGNYVVTGDDGKKVGMSAVDFELYYSKKKPKSTTE